MNQNEQSTKTIEEIRQEYKEKSQDRLVKAEAGVLQDVDNYIQVLQNNREIIAGICLVLVPKFGEAILNHKNKGCVVFIEGSAAGHQANCTLNHGLRKAAVEEEENPLAKLFGR
jgi:hypothetical protein